MIEILRPVPGEPDGYGAPTVASVDRYQCSAAYTAPRMSADVNDPARAGVVVGLTLFVPFGFDVLHGDQVDVAGVLYEVDGDPADWENPFTGWEAGTTIALRRVDG